MIHTILIRALSLNGKLLVTMHLKGCTDKLVILYISIRMLL